MPEPLQVTEAFETALRHIMARVEVKPPEDLMEVHAADLARRLAHPLRPNEVTIKRREFRPPDSLTAPLEVVVVLESEFGGLDEGTSPLVIAADGEKGPARDRYLHDLMRGPLITFTCPRATPEEGEKRVEAIGALLRTRMEAIRAGFGRFEEALAKSLAEVQARVSEHEERLQKIVERSQFTVIRRDAPRGRDVTTRIRARHPLMVPSADGQFAITDNEYADILDKMRDAACFFEGTPLAFWPMSEPLLRDAVAFVLKANFYWTTGGELFRNVGKTDISVLVSTNAIFIAELKKWTGAQSYAGVKPDGERSALEQVMDYTTWRETKVVLMCFSGRRGFKRTVDKALATVQAHPSRRGDVRRLETNEFVSRHENPDRAEHFVTVTHVFVDLGAAGGEDDEPLAPG